MSYYDTKMGELDDLLHLVKREKISMQLAAEAEAKRLSAAREEADLYRAEAERHVAEARNDLSRIAEEKARGFPWLAAAYADYFHLQDMEVAALLEGKQHPAQKAAERVREVAARRRVAEEAYRILKYQLATYENLFPWLVDFKGEDLDDLIRQRIERKESGKVALDEPDDPAKKWLAQAEWDKLPTAEKYQKALERYWQKPKHKWEIGRDYERYVGYLYEKDGYEVHYHGIVEGFDDLGRDLICTRGKSVEIVQCKHWSKDKQIHEKHICQLHGTFIAYTYDNPTVKASARFVTSTALSERARGFAQRLGIKVEEGHSPKPYPCIKCNISRRTGEKIYHLPFDQQYDRTIIEQERNECYVETVEEAEQLGFRRAFRWRGEGEG
jgi:hypothetical protein